MLADNPVVCGVEVTVIVPDGQTAWFHQRFIGGVRLVSAFKSLH